MSDPTNQLQAERQKIYDYVYTMLGGGMVDVELDPIHYETALDRALSRFRQRSQGSVEEAYYFLEVQENVNDYKLPDEIIEVRQIFRRSIGSRTGGGEGGTLFEPFNLAYTNTYLLSSSNMGGLATYFLFAGYQEMVGRMFGSFIEFKWNTNTHTLTLLQRPFAREKLMLMGYNYVPDHYLMTNVYSKQWIRDYTLATCKLMLAQAREKFSQIAGPQGGGSLNGAALKAEGTAELEALEKEVATGVPSGANAGGYSFLIG